ncbi:glycerate kinase, partial [Oscillochloris sp. ZM17-4]|uniref:glycerate kinase type-2 family protein n=1 Tax=Oscillochloris sp. ZM17-4 TaxID=2866714 RepID=UPI001C731D2A
ERSYDLARVGRVRIVGSGKAGRPMAAAAADVLGDRLSGGVMVIKRDTTQDVGAKLPHPGSYHILAAGHPVPDERSVAGARRIADLLSDSREGDLVIALISGGGSALLSLPAPGLSLADIQALTGQLLACGASIDEINTIRKHLDIIKGGGLARMAHPADLVTLVLSDVVGSPLDVIASGPTVPDPSSFADALAVLDRHGLPDRAPPAIVDRLRRGAAGERAETPGPSDPCFARASTLLVGGNPQAAEAAERAARAAGLSALILTTYLQGEAREAGRFLGAIGRELASAGRPLPRPACVIVGGETTVTLRGDGRGGRNQELALAAVGELAGLPDVALITLATDGGDGPTDAAGAVVTGETLSRARALGLDPAASLARNDAYPFFTALGDLLRPGPTDTNVNDLAFLFAW